MRNRWRRSFALIVFAVLLFSQSVVLAADNVSDQYSKTIEYLPDGSYYEIEIVEHTNARSTVTGASKTATFKNADGKTMWYVKVTANYYFNGTTSNCTSASVSAGSYVSTWKILGKSSRKIGSTASATAIAGQYLGSTLIGKLEKTVTLSCDSDGKLS